jgi:cbb3-type cytochrome oxidase maturation protein
MDIMLLLFGLAGIVAAIAVACLFWAIKTGQFDDPEGNSARILFDDEGQPKKKGK